MHIQCKAGKRAKPQDADTDHRVHMRNRVEPSDKRKRMPAELASCTREPETNQPGKQSRTSTWSIGVPQDSWKQTMPAPATTKFK